MNRELLIKKLLYKSRNRGCKETDIILGRFAEKFMNEMSDCDLSDFGILLEQSDSNIYDWVTQKSIVPKNLDSKILRMLLDFNITEQKI